MLACVSTYLFVHVCVIWCVWCVVVKHICLQAISFAYLSQPVHWVSGSLMHTVFHWQLWYSWSPTAMVRCTPGCCCFGRQTSHTHMKRMRSVYLCVFTHTYTYSTSQSQLHWLSIHAASMQFRVSQHHTILLATTSHLIRGWLLWVSTFDERTTAFTRLSTEEKQQKLRNQTRQKQFLNSTRLKQEKNLPGKSYSLNGF